MPNVVVIGAGPGGLTAAYELGKHGIGATVLEADDQVGGLSRTVSYEDYRFDIGGHRFFSKSEVVNELWHEILGEDFLLRPRLSRIWYRDRFFDYPLKPQNALTGLGPIEALRVVASYAGARIFPSREEKSFEQWVVNRFGQRLYEIFFKTYTEKVWGIPCAQISADWATQRIRNLSLIEALRNALFRGERGGDGEIITSLIEQFHYPRFGPGMMWEKCADLVDERGGDVRLNSRVERIRHRDGRVFAVEARAADGALVELPTDEVIATMPLRELVRSLDPAPPEEVLQAASALTYRDYLTVVLIVGREHVFPDNWIYIHSPEVRVGRVQNYKNWSPWMVPDTSRTALGLEYFLWESDPEWTWSREKLIQVGIDDCARIGLVAPEEVEDGTVVRAPKAYPVYDHHYQENVTKIRGYLSGIANLQTVGRNGQHRYNNQDHSMLAGLYAARIVVDPGGRASVEYDVWDVNVDSEYHEEGRLDASRPGVADRLVPTPLPDDLAGELDPVRLIEAAFARLDAVALGVSFAVVASLALLIATTIALVGGAGDGAPGLPLLSNYLLGYRVSWTGMWVGAAEAAGIGFVSGAVLASLSNVVLLGYARVIRRREAARERSRLLDEV